MKTTEDVSRVLKYKYKELEKEFDIKIRNGQTVEGIRKALLWVIE